MTFYPLLCYLVPFKPKCALIGRNLIDFDIWNNFRKHVYVEKTQV
jgi:hypothetical protein